MKQPVIKLLSWLLLLTLAGCGGSGDEYVGFDASVKVSTPNKYLAFFNRQGDLPAGDYTLVVATATANQAGSFSVSFTRNNGSATQLISGSWIDSGGLDSDRLCGTGNRCYAIDMQDATGATFVLNTALDGVLYLVDDSDTAEVVEIANANTAGVSETLKYSASEIDESDFASAYYSAIDPGNARDTAQKFLALHGFDNPDAHVIFRDSKDLGYGRDMYMRSYANTSSSCGGRMIVFFVRNFSVQIVDGFAYGPVNLEAAIKQDLKHHFGSNAIEFGLGRSDAGDTCSSEPMAKFYSFKTDYSTPNAPHPRSLRVDLDGRGAKAMPQPCISCHGGKLRPLDRFGRFVTMHANDMYVPGTYPPAPGEISDIGDTKARMQAFEVDSFEFSETAGYRRSDYEEGLRQFNLAIYCTYPGSDALPGCSAHGGGVPARATRSGEWSGDFGREVLLGWYQAAGLATPGARFDSSYVPVGWTPTVGGPPVGADTLFTKVIGPNCFVCHGKRGTDLGSNFDALGGKDLDFSTWSKFISHADEIESRVFDEGNMPLGLLNYQDFWNDPEKAELLASFIAPHVTNTAGFQARRLDADDNVILPGRVLARAGPDRVTRPGDPISLNAGATLFADSYSWAVQSSPTGSSFSLGSPNRKRSDFSADTDGSYLIRMTATSSEGGTASDSLTVVLDSGLARAPRDLSFYTDINALLDPSCARDCHRSGSLLVPTIPVWWTESQPFVTPPIVNSPPQLGFFEQVMARVNLEHIEDSLILKKPSNRHHYGGEISGFNTAAAVGTPARAGYDMFVNWIAEGTACGGTAQQCPR